MDTDRQQFENHLRWTLIVSNLKIILDGHWSSAKCRTPNS